MVLMGRQKRWCQGGRQKRWCQGGDRRDGVKLKTKQMELLRGDRRDGVKLKKSRWS